MKSIRPRIEGDVVIAAARQPQYLPLQVIPANNPKHHWLCPRCQSLLPPEMEQCTGPLGAANHGPVAREDGYNSVIMCFELDGEQRQQIINGENVYISLLTFGRPQNPIMFAVGPEEIAERHNRKVIERALHVTQADGSFDDDHSRADDDGMPPVPERV